MTTGATGNLRCLAVADQATAPSAVENKPAPAVLIECRRVELLAESAGQVFPWIGPAVRGVVARRFKERVCSQPVAEQFDRWRYCRGCPRQNLCGYGVTYESADANGDEGSRAVVITPTFPLETSLVPGSRFALNITAIGATAASHLDELTAAITASGQQPGLGPDRIRFRPLGAAMVAQRRLLVAADFRLPGDVGDSCDIHLRLTGPLFLRVRCGSKRSPLVQPPPFDRLLATSMRSVRRFCGRALPDLPFLHDEVLQVARGARLYDARAWPFQQSRASNRSQQSWKLQGVCGEFIYTGVPRAVLPWLEVAGILHVGDHRVAGAGGWELNETVAPRPWLRPRSPR